MIQRTKRRIRMSAKVPMTLTVLVTAFGAGEAVAANPLGFDTGWPPEQSAAFLQNAGIGGEHGTWLRLRDLPQSEIWNEDGEIVTPWEGAIGTASLSERRKILVSLRQRGHRIVALLRWKRESWDSGTRTHHGRSWLPSNLLEPFQRSFDLAYTYGDLIDAWEVENEPDIGFVPENAETFASFHKACALGIIAGRQASISHMENSKGQFWRPPPNKRAVSAVMHSPLALPPGPYWDELVANDVLNYTEAFNYHFYGYPEDFQGVRNVWIAALNEAISPKRIEWRSKQISDFNRVDSNMSASALPLFLTEYGYGLLDRYDRHTIEGRERQKRFFTLTVPSITDGSIVGAMAFVIKPYYENGVNEFGLLAEVPNDVRSKSDKQHELNLLRGQRTDRDDQTKNTLEHSHDSENLDPLWDNSWGHDVSLLSEFNRPSSVVIDFIAGDEIKSVKRYNGHILPHAQFHAKAVVNGSSGRQESSESVTSSGEFSIVLYNFSDESITGTLAVDLGLGEIIEIPAAAKTAATTASPPTADDDRTPAKRTARPYIRPISPRSSLLPSVTTSWPDANTRIIKNDSNQSYVMTSALEFLLDAASKVNDRKGEIESQNYLRPTKLTRTRDLDQPEPTKLISNLANKPRTNSDQSPFLKEQITLKPRERREIKLFATIPSDEFQPHRLSATWLTKHALPRALNVQEEVSETASGDLSKSLHPSTRLGNPIVASRLETQLYPSTSVFRLQQKDTFEFTAEDNAEARGKQLTRSRANGEAMLTQNPALDRWLNTPGSNIEETPHGWRITINDLPPAPLRYAEIELPLPDDWVFPPDASLSFRYRLVPADPTDSNLELPYAEFKLKQNDPARYEEFDVNLRYSDGSLWSVWPRLFAKRQTQSYLEFSRNFTPMFFSRPVQSESLPVSLTFTFRPRVLPCIIEVDHCEVVELAFRNLGEYQ